MLYSLLTSDVPHRCSDKHQPVAANPGWKILVVDDTAMKVISAAVGMYDIMERKVTLVEALEKKRAPFPDMGAIYILSPTKESIDRLLADYSHKSNVLYGPNVFLYFLGKVPLQYLEQLKKCKQLIKRLKALSEINVDFLVKEQRAYVLDVDTPFSSYYVRTAGNSSEEKIALKLVTVCATLNEYPYIRYKRTSGICSSLANVFKMKMDEFVGSNPSWWYHGSGKSEKKSAERDRSTMLLLDRSSDCLTPLMHDFTYQSMVHDLLTMEGDKITYSAESPDDPNAKEDKDVLLNEKDKLWVEMRGKHIAQVIEILSGRINEVVNSSTNSALSKDQESGSNMSIQQLASALKELPEYREVMSKLSQHMHIAHECMDNFTRGGLMDVSDIEQTLATGKDEDGRSVKLPELISRVEGALIRTTDVKDRLRLILVATVSQNGLSSADRDRLLRAAQLSRDELLTLESLSKLGIQTLNNSGSSDVAAAGGFFSG
jgi:syntaxin-binding protein 1